MGHKPSNAPRPTGSLPIGHAEPAAQAKPKTKLPKATSVAALHFQVQFRKAIRTRNRADAKFYAQKCQDEGLPEPWLTEVYHLLDRLLGNRHVSTPAQKRRGREPTKFEAIVKAMRAMPRAKLEGMKEVEMEAHFKVSRDTARRARNTVLSDSVDNSNSDK
jgi:hypothetical protein